MSQAVDAPRKPFLGTPASARTAYLDNLKGLLCVIVIVHHVLITYGSEGSWFYIEHTNRLGLNLALTTIDVFNQFFFMGLFFFLSAIFVPGAVDREGPAKFLKKRAFQLGVPLLVWVVFVAPPLLYVSWSAAGYRGTFSQYLHGRIPLINSFAPGPLWFIETLLLFSAMYLLFHRLNAPAAGRRAFVLCAHHLVLFGGALWIGSILVRMLIPIGAEVWHLQLGFFPQYVLLFSIGVFLARRDFLGNISTTLARRCAAVAVVGMALIPLLLAGALRDRSRIPEFIGGFHAPAIALAGIEALICPTAIVALLVLFRERFAEATGAWRFFAMNSYGAYVIHAPVVVALSLAIRDAPMHPLLKAVLVCFAGVAGSFAFSEFILCRAPGARAIFRPQSRQQRA